MVSGLQKISSVEGVSGLTRGVVPTFYGYGAQGLFKFGLNEVFQDVYKGVIGGEQKLDTKYKKMALQAAASGSAEFFADIALCPFEMTKVKMQLQIPGQPQVVPFRLIPAMQYMHANAAQTNFPLGSLKPLWGRQIPYTIIKFVVFYQTAEFVYDQIEQRKGLVKSEVSNSVQLAITFGCGYWAGIFCAVATQPMDNLVSMAGLEANKGKGWGQLASEMGAKDLFLKGLPTRILMVGTLTGLQWWIYGSVKSALGFGSY